jgi:alpha-L-arabinofuranosidase
MFKSTAPIHHRSVLLFCLVLIFVPLFGHSTSQAKDLNASITIYIDQPPMGRVNPLVFGHNLESMTPNMERVKYTEAYSSYGGGIWDPIARRPQKRAIQLAKEAGMTAARFPGGCISHAYRWKLGIGPLRKRPRARFGIDDFMQVCKTIGCTPVITVSYFGGVEDAADLVEYLNAPNDGSNPRAGIDWANMRAKYGHPEPYNVRFFEVGNEVWHGFHDGDLTKEAIRVSAEQYADDFLKFCKGMREIDSSILIGIIGRRDDSWNETVLGVAGKKIDFMIVHSYYPGSFVPLEKEQLADYFKYLLAAPQQVWAYYKNILELVDRTSGRPGKVGIAVTEYNGSYGYDKPIPYRHTLGNALYLADLLSALMHPDNRIIMANFWQFINEHWGAVSGPVKPYEQGPLIKRPQFYPFQMYNKYFYRLLLKADVVCPSYTIIADPKYNRVKVATVRYLSVNASRSEDGKTVCLMVINKHPDKPIETKIDVPGFDFDNKVQIHTLSGPSMEATNELDPDNVSITSRENVIKEDFAISFPPHSLSAVIIKSK